VFSEIGPIATGETASRPTPTKRLRREAPSSASTIATRKIVAIPHRAIRPLKAAL